MAVTAVQHVSLVH